MFVLDLETLSTSESAVVLSAALLYFKEDESAGTNDELYDLFLNRCCFVKFSVEEQLSKYKRTVDKSTMSWWKEQSKAAKDISLRVTDNDVSVIEGISVIEDYVKTHSVEKEEVVWTRGSLDQFCFDSLFAAINKQPLFHYGRYMDLRTAINLLKDNARRGYCTVPNFNIKKVIKHHPVHDCCYDALMLIKG